MEYCSLVFHTLIAEEESVKLDRFESQCLKNIYGRRLSYKSMLKKAELDSLSVRRQNMFDKFAEKAAAPPRFRKWFPTYHSSRAGNTRHNQLYKEYHARTDRLYFPPICYEKKAQWENKTNEPVRSRVRLYLVNPCNFFLEKL